MVLTMQDVTFYFESLINLKTQFPYRYQQFLVGDFVVKTNEGSFNAVVVI